MLSKVCSSGMAAALLRKRCRAVDAEHRAEPRIHENKRTIPCMHACMHAYGSALPDSV